MSVFTPLENSEIADFIAGFDLGGFVAAKGIAGGSENTNYFVDCESGHYVLTLVERGPGTELTFFVGLLEQLHQAGLPVPYAITDRQGVALHELKKRPALLQPRLPGRHVEQVGQNHCAAIGDLLAQLHAVNADAATELVRASDRGPRWILSTAFSLLDHDWHQERGWLEPALMQLREWLEQSGDAGPQAQLPSTVIHGDLFRDNALFDGTQLTGVIDFYNAATGWAIFDLAVCVNDWCVDATADNTAMLSEQRCIALLQAYASRRPFSAAEKHCWPMMLQLAALRFWTSRQNYLAAHKGQEGILVKDPEHFRAVMRMHVSRIGHCPLP